jgi:hypothetical protein
MAFQLPNPIPQCVGQIADEDAPTLLEVNTFQTTVDTWSQQVLMHLTFLNPTHGFNQCVPIPSVAASTLDELILKVTQLQAHVDMLFPIYGHAYMNTAQ